MTEAGLPASLAARHVRLDPLIKLALLLATILLLAGIFAPMLTLTKFVWFRSETSLFGAIVQLWRDAQYLLSAILLLFSVVLPVAKLVLLHRFWHADSSTRDQLQRFVDWVGHYGKWSMLDVFVVSLLLVTVKLGALASVEIHAGIYAYASAGILTMAMSALLNHVAAGELAVPGSIALGSDTRR